MIEIEEDMFQHWRVQAIAPVFNFSISRLSGTDRLSEMRICNVAARSTSDLITIRGWPGNRPIFMQRRNILLWTCQIYHKAWHIMTYRRMHFEGSKMSQIKPLHAFRNVQHTFRAKIGCKERKILSWKKKENGLFIVVKVWITLKRHWKDLDAKPLTQGRLWTWLNVLVVGSQRPELPKNVNIEPIIRRLTINNFNGTNKLPKPIMCYIFEILKA